MLWFNFILGLNFIFLCFRLIIIHYHNLKQREMKFKPRIKLNLNIYLSGILKYDSEIFSLGIYSTGPGCSNVGNRYPADKYLGNQLRYPVDSFSSGG